MSPMLKQLAPTAFVWTACIALASCSASGPPPAQPAPAAQSAPSARKASSTQATRWLGTWASSQQIPEPDNALPASELTNATLRQIVHLTVGGKTLRIRFSNQFGNSSLRIAAADIARPVSLTSGTIDQSTVKPLTFNGRPGVTIPPGASYYSDPLSFPAAPLSNLAVTIYLRKPPKGETSHPGSRETSFLVHGNHIGATKLPHAMRFNHWFFLSGVDVRTHGPAAAIVALGDSITDGHATPNNSNTRWPDDLARRLQADSATRNISVLNAGLGGNRLLRYGLGPDALARFDRDVLGQPGVRYLIVIEGVNDLGVATMHRPLSAAQNATLIHNMIGAYRQIILQAREHHIKVIGGTITPFKGSNYYHPSAATLQDRREINDWIRAPGHFDAVIHFAHAVRDPKHPQRLRPMFDSGDNLHPNPAGYEAMADAIPLSLFKRSTGPSGAGR